MSWLDDPLERTRYVDGEGEASERHARARDLLRDPVGRARIEEEARLAALLHSAFQDAGAPSADLPPGLTSRVRAALARDRAWGASARRRRVLALAASVLLASGAAVFAFRGRVPEVSAAGREVLLAIETLRDAEAGTLPGGPTGGGSCDEGIASPHRFPLVVSGEASVESCAPSEHETVAVIGRGTGNAAAAHRGLVVVPSDGRSSATDVGWQRIGDVVVFDVSVGRATYYLATRWDGVEGTPACAACHGPVRASQPARNPHRFIAR